MPGKVEFYEQQRFTQIWLWIVVMIAPVLAWWVFIEQIIQGNPAGSNPGPDWLIIVIWIIIGLCMPLLLAVVRMRTTVESDVVTVAFSPLHSRTIRLEEISSVRAIEYHPVQEFGGWGIRWVAGGGMVYNVSGKLGVRLELKNGKWVLIGSQKASQLASILTGALTRVRG